MRTPPWEPDRLKVADEEVRPIMRAAACAGRSLLTEPEAKAVIAAFGIPTVAHESGGLAARGRGNR